jgi:hypothetical protein
MNRAMLLIVFCALLVIPSLAQNPQNQTNCSLTGTWLGGSDPTGIPSYQATITPEADGRYMVLYQAMYDPGTHFTSWTGELRKGEGKTYSEYAAATYIISQDMADFYQTIGIQVDPGSFEVDGVYTQKRMLDCNTFQSTITWFGWYIPITAEKIPFVTPPEVEFIHDANGGQPIVEIYHRVGPDCPICGSASKASRGVVDRKTLPKWHLK